MNVPDGFLEWVESTAKKAKADTEFMRVYRNMSLLGMPNEQPPGFFAPTMRVAVFAAEYTWWKTGRGEFVDGVTVREVQP